MRRRKMKLGKGEKEEEEQKKDVKDGREKKFRQQGDEEGVIERRT